MVLTSIGLALGLGGSVLAPRLMSSLLFGVSSTDLSTFTAVPLALGSLEQDLYGNGLPDPTRYEEVYERELLIELVERRIEKDHREDIREIFRMLRQGYRWDEIAARLEDPKPEALKKRFWRWIRRNFQNRH